MQYVSILNILCLLFLCTFAISASESDGEKKSSGEIRSNVPSSTNASAIRSSSVGGSSLEIRSGSGEIRSNTTFGSSTPSSQVVPVKQSSSTSLSTSKGKATMVAVTKNVGDAPGEDYDLTVSGVDPYIILKIWDHASEDGDQVKILKNGVPVYSCITIKNNPVTLNIPLAFSGVDEIVIDVIGIYDGGGGITYAVEAQSLLQKPEVYENRAGVGAGNRYTIHRDHNDLLTKGLCYTWDGVKYVCYEAPILLWDYCFDDADIGNNEFSDVSDARVLSFKNDLTRKEQLQLFQDARYAAAAYTDQSIPYEKGLKSLSATEFQKYLGHHTVFWDNGGNDLSVRFGNDAIRYDPNTGFFESETGLGGRLLFNTDKNEIIVSYRGTNFSENDFKTDLYHAGGGLPKQHILAYDLLRSVIRNSTNEKIKVVGHSLGGGLALYATINNTNIDRVETITFNSAGLSEGVYQKVSLDKRRNASKKITNLRTNGDPVTLVDEHLGRIVEVDNSLISDHPIRSVEDSIVSEILNENK